MTRIFRFIFNIIMISSLLLLFLSIYQIFDQYNAIRTFEKTIISYAQKNGGFMDSYNPHTGQKTTDFEEFYMKCLANLDLQDRIHSIEFYPKPNTPVQKRERFTVVVEPKIYIVVPYSDEDISFIGNGIERSGYSSKYFKY